MKEFIAEYGLLIVVAVLVLIYLAFATPIGEKITKAIEAIVDDLISTSDAFYAAVPTPTV